MYIYMCVCVYSILLVLLAESPCLLHSLLAGAKSHLLFVKPAGLYLDNCAIYIRFISRPAYVATRNRGSLYGRRCSLDQTPFLLCVARTVREHCETPRWKTQRNVAVSFRQKKRCIKTLNACRSCHVLES
jgi:hypothetical protein